MGIDREKYLAIDEQLNRFLEFFAYNCCSCKSPFLWASRPQDGRPFRAVGCCRTTRPDGKPHHAIQGEGFWHPDKAHHTGYMHKILEDGPMIPASTIRAWSTDVAHGLAHGFCTAFMLFWMQFPSGIPDDAFEQLHGRKKEISPLAQQLVGAMLHDFTRTLVIKEIRDPLGNQDGHDKILEEWFPGLWPAAFTHATMPPDTDDPLVNADRMELRRFPDWENWVRPNYMKHVEAQLPSDLVFYFYKFIRPAISYLLEYRHDLWFRHGPERIAYGGGEGFAREEWEPDDLWPRKWVPQVPDNLYCVETGRPPFSDCFWHGRGFQPWGFIPRKVAIQYAKPRAITRRDHLGLDTAIPVSKWVFLYGRKHNKFEDAKHRWLAGKLVRHGVGHIELLTVQRMFSVIDRFMEFFCALRVEEDDELCR